MTLPPITAGSRRRLLARLVLNGALQAALAIAAVLLTRAAFDALAAGAAAGVDTAVRVGLTLAGMAAAVGALRLVERVDAERLGQDYVADVRTRLFAWLAGTSPRSLRSRSAGAVMLPFLGDLSALKRWVSQGLARLAVSTLVAAAVIAALVALHWPIGLGVGLVVAAGVAGCFALGPRMRAAEREVRRRRSRLAARVHEQIAALAVVQTFGQGERELRRLMRRSTRLQQAAVGRARIAGLVRSLAEGASAAAAGIVLCIGAAEVGAGRTGLGTLVAAMAVAGLLAPHLRDVGRLHETWSAAQVARRKIEAVLGRDAGLADGAQRLPRGPGRIAFENVTVDGALHGVSAAAAAGSRIALVGPNGAGKTTLLALLARLQEPACGRVLIDGHDLAVCARASVRRHVAMAGPELPLLRGTVDSNLRYGRRSARADAMHRVAALCGVDALLEELPLGERTVIGEGGANLSAGQRARIALARALLRDPVILLLDEADAHLDAQARAAIDRVLEQFRGTVLMVTHDAGRLARVDEIWYLEAGRLVEAGPPEQLLGGAGRAATLFGPARSAAA